MVVVTLTPPRKKMVDIIPHSTKSNKYKIKYCKNIYNIKSRLEKKCCHIFTMYKISMHNNINAKYPVDTTIKQHLFQNRLQDDKTFKSPGRLPKITNKINKILTKMKLNIMEFNKMNTMTKQYR